MKKNLLIIVVLIQFLLACDATSKREMLIGTWVDSISISAQDAAKLFDDPLPSGVTIELSGNGTTTYHHGNKYNSYGEATIRIKYEEGEEYPLRIMLIDAGTWELHGDILVETSTDSKVIPIDEDTRSFINEDPDMLDIFSPLKGDTTSVKINYITPSLADMELLDPPNVRYTMRKKGT